MHLVAIKKSLYERHPFIATSLFNAFQRAKEIALERMYNLRALRYMMPWLPRDVDEIFEYFDGDPWPYGVEENRPTLEALVQYLQDQSLTDWKPTLEELFAPVFSHGVLLISLSSLVPSYPSVFLDHAPMSNLDALLKCLVLANRILASEDVVDAYGHVSVRIRNNPKRSSCRARARRSCRERRPDRVRPDGQPVARTRSASPISSASSTPPSSQRTRT